MQNCTSDYRDTLTILADLYVQAEKAGIEAKPLFERASEFSTDTPTRGGCQSLARMLRDFDSYAVLSERRRMTAPYHDPGA
jgi:hypothetical protein